MQIIPSREATLEKINQLLIEQRELQRKNRHFQKWILKHMSKMQEKVVAVDTIEESEKMGQIYRRTLYTYNRHLDDVTERKTRITFDMQSYEDKVQKTRDENARVFDELLDRERELARGKGLIYAKTGRMLTEKAVNEITRRQHRLEDVIMELQNLETLGTGMTTTDYENLHAAYVSYRDKLDERDRELEKLRHKIGEMVNGIAHYKEKGTCLAEDIKFEERELNEYREQTASVREDVNKLHLTLRDLRWAQDEMRLECGLLMAPPVLHETEKLIKMLAAVRYDIEIIKREIHRHDPAN
ncbi:hypothetical protein PUN28_006181 [Cardiocondyla obscurior]|uniref:CCDC113/CCDC96 coiled-coil domain-containing protein n=1 Tax=Cardiocondyla obscurior TaxID=286306 RepID=A0AAW2G985_9HYME